MSEEEEFQTVKDRLRRRLLKYTRRAFRMLPRLDGPRILDIGCGSGVPTIELARLGRGQVIGLDIDSARLDRLRLKIKKAKLSDRVTVLKCSMFDMHFPEGSFDIIWAEGSIAKMGFAAGLREWRRLLKPGGYLVVHDEEGNIKEKTYRVRDQGYSLLHWFALDEKTWWHEYYALLESEIRKSRDKWTHNPMALAMLDAEQEEVEMVRRNPQRHRSAYFVMKKGAQTDELG
jgi:ubiquinone/menaquinone biosynthesis C-methylase UbiE